MTLDAAYLTAWGAHLPGRPIKNGEIEHVLGKVAGKASRTGPAALRRNRIKQRHYALDADGVPRTTAAAMAAQAVRQALAGSERTLADIDFLAAATTQNDLLAPGFASGVHAALRLPPLEIASFQSVCASVMMALKAAVLQVKADAKRVAAVAAAEFASRFLRAAMYDGTDLVDADGHLDPDADFLRFTLSDGAGAALVEPRRNEHGPSLRVDWISLRSFADRFDTCMIGGGRSDEDGAVHPWSHCASPGDAARQGLFTLRQDFRLLERMIPLWVAEYMRCLDERRLRAADVDWLLCHYSAHHFREDLVRLARQAGCLIPEERWFTNLYDVGNVGSASILVMIEELMRRRDPVPGQRILCIVPESGRAIVSLMHLTVC
ncbi:MAG: 3-oxoacyl-ACP synthase [Alphaproteobacteria bacterium]|nr:3-oxoacyl-ACP synthase [Alphaproteobacteria bacterium]